MTTTTVIMLALAIYGAFGLLYRRHVHNRKKSFDEIVRSHPQVLEDERPRG